MACCDAARLNRARARAIYWLVTLERERERDLFALIRCCAVWRRPFGVDVVAIDGAMCALHSFDPRVFTGQLIVQSVMWTLEGLRRQLLATLNVQRENRR